MFRVERNCLRQVRLPLCRCQFRNGINQINTNIVKASVYPVPAKEKITISFGSIITKAELEIFSADMKTVRRESINGLSATKEINISNLSKGVYFIRYANGSATEILRFIKE